MVGRRREDKYHRHPATSSLPCNTRRKSQQDYNLEENENIHPLNGIQLTLVVSHEMVHYCFDVLLNHLNRCEVPRSRWPKFTNDP